MYRNTVFLFCVIASQVSRLNGQEKIVGGTATTISQYPYQISLTSNGNHICGGAILDRNSIITAAHCVNGASVTALKIRAGSTSRTTGGVLIAVASFKMHPNFNPTNLDFDMAMITLKSNLTMGTNIKAVPIYTQQLYSGVNAIATGWGTLQEGGSLSDTLQKVSLPVLSKTTCLSVFGSSLDESMFCAGRMSGGIDTCQGDSGGPLVMNGYLIGITSHGNGCAKVGYPGLYTRVPMNQNWIRANM